MIDRDSITRAAEFHGHMCPGLAMGIRAAEVALREIGPHSADEEIVAIVETDMCGVDAIQFLTGCTFGKGNLVHRDHGKNVYTFVRRSDGRALRISLRPGGWGPQDPELGRTRAAITVGTANEDERQRFWSQQRQRSEHILTQPLEELYEIRDVDLAAPRRARIHTSVECAACGEPTMETRIRRLEGQELCLPCFEQRLADTAMVSLSSTAGVSGRIASSAGPAEPGLDR
ncbi:MAG: FmdE family protein [Actinomycetota bacterium]|nr:FmdE family protein [Actinomycetota bacterium]